MKISLGGILSFAGIFIVAILIANISAAIFQDEWLVQVLPRGIAPAISLMLRIIIITVGLYIGLNAAGFPIEQIGFVLGALGVGIGFGFQNVVLNFISVRSIMSQTVFLLDKRMRPNLSPMLPKFFVVTDKYFASYYLILV